MPATWMTSEQASRRLDVKPETLYAYVSRGLIRSERIPGQRRSRFLAADVERHAARSRSGGRAAGLEVVVETELTMLDPAGSLTYRGHDVVALARHQPIEAVASLLWTGDLDPQPMRPRPTTPAMGALAAIDGLDLVDGWRAMLIPLRAADPLRHDRRAAAVATTGRTMIASLLATSPRLGADPGPDAGVAARLWPCLTAAPPSARRLAVLDAALVLLADHEMATSTLAARVAASTWADPYLVVQAGLAAVAGSLHGGAGERARRLLRDAGPDGAQAATAVGDRLADGARIPGFGHRVYETCDPRGDALLDLLDADRHAIPPAAAPVLEVVAAQDLPFPNIDFALAAVAEAYEMIEGATEAIFALARIVGWLAHAIEEYPHALRFRTRAAYVGPGPRPTG